MIILDQPPAIIIPKPAIIRPAKHWFPYEQATFPFPMVVPRIGAPATWQTNAQATLTGNNGGWNGFTLRMRVAAAGLANGGGSKARVTLMAGSSAGFTIDSAYIGAGASTGDVYDYETTPTQLTFNTGSAGVTVTTGNSIVSDEITYTVDASKPLIVSMHFSATSAVGLGSPVNWNGYYKSGVSEAGTVNVSGYTIGGGSVSYCVSKIESFV